MDMQQPQEDASWCDILKLEELVAQTPERDERADRSPDQKCPKPKAVLDHRHHLQLDANKVRSIPFTWENHAVVCGRRKEGSGYPSMKPLRIYIRETKKEADNVDFASQENDQRALRDRHPYRSLSILCAPSNMRHGNESNFQR